MESLNARFVDAQKALEEFAGKKCWFCAAELENENKWEKHGHVCTDCGREVGAELTLDCGRLAFKPALDIE
ncbi:MAG: hypothetical protein ABH829_03640 [archaeon]